MTGGCAGCAAGAVSASSSEATFSRAFAEFAGSGLASRLHETLIARDDEGAAGGAHLARCDGDRGAGEAGGEGAEAEAAAQAGASTQGEERAKEPSRLERQLTMTLPQMLEDLPKPCDVGMKKNAKGLVEKWIGYKLHIDTADGGIPISCVMTSASTHDSRRPSHWEP